MELSKLEAKEIRIIVKETEKESEKRIRNFERLEAKEMKAFNKEELNTTW
jgi:hypothetical protein